MSDSALLTAPFPYFGGKSHVVAEVWRRFGNPVLYVEPFCGSAAVLLGRPAAPRSKVAEVINDKDGYITNFWRAVRADPEGVAKLLQWPINQIDMTARHRWLCEPERVRNMLDNLHTDPDWYDVKIAAWWCWGRCIWIGRGWCDRELQEGGDIRKGWGKRPSVTSECGAIGRKGALEYIRKLSQRLSNVAVFCGDWTKALAPGVLKERNPVAVFFDPPYAEQADRCTDIYAVEDLSVANDVREWAIEHGNDKRFRIALCGYEGEHEMPDDWECYAWKAPGGMGAQFHPTTYTNCLRERIWFSPHCIKPNDTLGLT